MAFGNGDRHQPIVALGTLVTLIVPKLPRLFVSQLSMGCIKQSCNVSLLLTPAEMSKVVCRKPFDTQETLHFDMFWGMSFELTATKHANRFVIMVLVP